MPPEWSPELRPGNPHPWPRGGALHVFNRAERAAGQGFGDEPPASRDPEVTASEKLLDFSGGSEVELLHCMSKSPKRRACPAAGREITAAECGEGRHSRLPCPADCPFNPFSPLNYDGYLELEEAADRAMMQQMNLDSEDRSELRRVMSQLHDRQDTLQLVSEINRRCCYRVDLQGQTLMQRWEKQGFSGLKNDLRVLLKWKMQVRVSLLEVHRVLDHERIEVVDLLDSDPQPRILHDRSVAARATRFMVGIGWIYPTPHFHRVVGAIAPIPLIRAMPPRQVLLELCRHLGAPEDEPSLRRWLAENLTRVVKASEATSQARHDAMMDSLDAQFGKARYRLNVPLEALCSRLRGQEDLVLQGPSEDERQEGIAWVWAALDRSLAAPDAPPTLPGAERRLGRILAGGMECRLEAMGTDNFSKLRARFEAWAGDCVQFVSISSEDLRPRIAPTGTKPDLDLVPPSLLANPEKLLVSTSTVPASMAHPAQPGNPEPWREAFDRAFLDEGVPALGGRTPRQAANDPKLRPTLIALMKDRVRSCDEENLRTGGSQDVNWMLRELGLTEILLDPPPRRNAPAKVRGEDWESDSDDDTLAEDEILEMDPSLPAAPPLPARPFTVEEVEARMLVALESGSTVEECIERMRADGCTLLEDVWTVAHKLVCPSALNLLAPLLALAWSVFVPPGTRGSNLSVEGLREAIFEEVAACPRPGVADDPSSGQLKEWLRSGPQPDLVMRLVAQLHLMMKAEPEPQSVESELVKLLVIIRAVVAELDAENRP